MKKRNFPWSPFVRFLAVLCLVFCCVPAVKSEAKKYFMKGIQRFTIILTEPLDIVWNQNEVLRMTEPICQNN